MVHTYIAFRFTLSSCRDNFCLEVMTVVISHVGGDDGGDGGGDDGGDA